MELEIKLDQGLKRQETNFESQPKLNSKATLLTLLHSTVHNKTNSTATLKETVPNCFFLTIIYLTRKPGVKVRMDLTRR